LTVLGVLVAIVVVAGGAVPPGLFGAQVAVAALIACFAAGAWSEKRVAMVVIVAALFAVTVLGSVGSGTSWIPAIAVAATLLVLPVVAGSAARSGRRYVEEVEARLADAESRQDERALLAIQEERTRIARELHDVVAHHVSLIGVQAGAARASLDASSPERTRDALAAIEVSSREAVGEMHQLVDVLRPLDGQGRQPQPGLHDLDRLVARWRDAGYAIAVDAPDLGVVAPTLSLSCYRVVEEALTNVARHSRARSVHVALRPTPAAIEVLVHDPGPPEPRPSSGGGRGLVGMAERAALFGGTVAAGPTADGGFSVLALLPRPATP
jgi:signal transduction histidine kinase